VCEVRSPYRKYLRRMRVLQDGTIPPTLELKRLRFRQFDHFDHQMSHLRRSVSQKCNS
jgi:hypothetical protein